jgi:hypothetical protein
VYQGVPDGIDLFVDIIETLFELCPLVLLALRFASRCFSRKSSSSSLMVLV